MSRTPQQGSAPAGLAPELKDRLGYLLKHAQLRLAEFTAQALAPLGISGRELAVLLVLSSGKPPSQQEAAQRLGVDRTSMVALIDVLENKGLVQRSPDADDRRRNVIELTDAGQGTLRTGSRASAAAEDKFLADVAPSAARQLKKSLQTLAQP